MVQSLIVSISCLRILRLHRSFCRHPFFALNICNTFISAVVVCGVCHWRFVCEVLFFLLRTFERITYKICEQYSYQVDLHVVYTQYVCRLHTTIKKMKNYMPSKITQYGVRKRVMDRESHVFMSLDDCRMSRRLLKITQLCGPRHESKINMSHYFV